MTTSAPILIDLLEPACERAIEAIKDRRNREHYVRIKGVSHDDRATIDYRGSETEARCADMVAACTAARASGHDTVAISAADAALIVTFIGRAE
jgi:hypothetical protein